ncbi:MULTISPECIES: TetR/AcrR family transcriptional regulator [unclassified Rathayibacter]|uniref:TetR/AcrR family transcriptional regulator n=1 Tax=unclassified Rathayibacter TaxID=2609250 RepID=UPI000F94BC65|nr:MULTISPECIES: TetR/AcrR family transcriptional regulator [unclassified Rathayibacter]ROP44343.1 TetR family transcriptional regulator [Rathayibacter sp. PhB186]ROS46843.1 TetR family transcriptional regulator [Rathayibacter sp. PhB185]
MTTTAPTKRGPYASTRKRRETIVAAVMGLVDELGHEGVTTSLVSQRSGVSETTVLYHFPSKDHLLVAALGAIEDERGAESQLDLDDTVIDARAFRRLPNPDSADPRFRLLTVLRGAAASPEHPAAEYFAARNARLVEVFARLIEHSQQKGLAHPAVDPRITARQVIAVWDGLMQFWISDPTFDLGAAVEDAIRRLTGQNLMEIQQLLGASFDTPPSR